VLPTSKEWIWAGMSEGAGGSVVVDDEVDVGAWCGARK
jgi:hypothetical protein